MDTLEKFIQENREKFDNQQPDQGIWLAIDRQMNEESKSLWQRFYSLGIAASVVLLLSAGIVIGLFINQDRSPDFYTEVELYDSNFEQTEYYYETQVQYRMNELKEYNVTPNVEELDKIYAELKREFETVNHQDKKPLVNAMIDNYKTRLEILELILERMEESKREEERLIH